MWHLWPQPQQRGAQFPARGGVPPEAVKDRVAQEHDRADQDVGGQAAVRQPVYPAGRMQDERKRDAGASDDLPLPEGK